ncbi:ParB/RepB/Spo0J family partition protein [Patescibacteria group bacterium]|nr:ParB/RepB/Spo0J family partition protein [Patescibacteria group bacterium]MBU4453367.1 ParB/RepB/Spo0J family partition protein [Patescibacteria group bacterium]MCG2687719.1 ParB/RepB/Spo0J family partition protein [Candidatus Parcubacteria bacterium]
MIKPQGGLGRGLGSLIPQKIAPAPDTEVAQNIAQAQESSVPTDKIVENPHQPRKYFSPADLEDLLQSIKEHGILQPLLVTKLENGNYELIAGERRFRCAKMLGLPTVPALVRTATEQQKLELALIENIQRSNLNAIEEARAYQSLSELFGLTQEQVAKRVGKSRSYVTNTIRLMDLSEEIQQAIMEKRISRSHARTLLAEPDLARRNELYNQMLKGGMSVREAEVRASTIHPQKKKDVDPNITAIETELRTALSTKVQLAVSGATSKLTIHFYSREELKDFIKRIVE